MILNAPHHPPLLHQPRVSAEDALALVLLHEMGNKVGIPPRVSAQILGRLLLSPARFVRQGARLIAVTMSISHPQASPSPVSSITSTADGCDDSVTKRTFSKGFHPFPGAENHPGGSFLVLLGPCDPLGCVTTPLPVPGATRVVPPHHSVRDDRCGF